MLTSLTLRYIDELSGSLRESKRFEETQVSGGSARLAERYLGFLDSRVRSASLLKRMIIQWCLYKDGIRTGAAEHYLKKRNPSH